MSFGYRYGDATADVRRILILQSRYASHATEAGRWRCNIQTSG